MEFIASYLAFCLLAAWFAHEKGRSTIGFFLLAFFVTPLLGVICAAAARPNIPKLQQRGVATADMRQCPKCPELAKPEAKFCRSCFTSLAGVAPIGPAAHFPATDPIVPKVFMVVIAYAILGALALANLAMQP